jgi:hypothetical protein
VRLILALLAFVSLSSAAAEYRLVDCGPIGQGDDTQAWQTCINLVRSANGGTIVTENRTYLVSSIDGTKLSGLRIRFQENTRIDPVHMTTAAAVFDFAGSSNVSLIGAGEIFASGPRPIYPTYAVRFIGEDKIHIDGLRTPGKFTSAAIGFYGVHSITIQRAQISNFDTAAPALWISNLPGRNSSDFASYNSEYHQGGGAPYTIWLQDSDRISFRDGIIDNSTNAHIISLGNVRNVTLDSVKFYSELGYASGAVILCNAPNVLAFLRITNPFRDGIPLITAGSGVDQSTLRIETP